MLAGEARFTSSPDDGNVCDACRPSATFDWPLATRSERSRYSSACRLKRIDRWTAVVVLRHQGSSNVRSASSIDIGARSSCLRWTRWQTNSPFIRAHCVQQRVTVGSASSSQLGQFLGGRFSRVGELSPFDSVSSIDYVCCLVALSDRDASL
jgi:hypothetical protein